MHVSPRFRRSTNGSKYTAATSGPSTSAHGGPTISSSVMPRRRCEHLVREEVAELRVHDRDRAGDVLGEVAQLRLLALELVDDELKAFRCSSSARRSWQSSSMSTSTMRMPRTSPDGIAVGNHVPADAPRFAPRPERLALVGDGLAGERALHVRRATAAHVSGASSSVTERPIISTGSRPDHSRPRACSRSGSRARDRRR